MTLIFWQNIVSPHQFPFIKKLAENNVRVILVVEKLMSEQRKKMGWQPPVYNENSNLKLIINPSEKDIEKLVQENSNAKHFFSGIRSNSLVFKAFKISLKYKVEKNLISEGPSYYKKPKFLHIIKTLLFERKYLKQINNIYTIGQDSYDWFKIWVSSEESLIPFSYCVDKIPYPALKKLKDDSKINILVVGSLLKLKGHKKLLDTINKIKVPVHLDIIGLGAEYDNLNNQLKEIDAKHTISFLGNMDNHKVRNLMLNYDSLVLPSLYDGWGAVVNEAIMAGLFVICSNACGAKELIQDKFNGVVFSHRKKNDLLKALNYVLTNISLIRKDKEKIMKWSRCIEGESISTYFLNTITNSKKTTPPWK